MTTTADLVVLNEESTWTLHAATDEAATWLRSITGNDDRSIEVDPVEGRELCNRAREEGLVVNTGD